jgi:uncharacterized protein involved in response to NO
MSRPLPIRSGVDAREERSPAAIAKDPYRLFFPIGMLLAWAGVGHWLLYAFGAIEKLHSVFHALTQVQGFLTAFAIGFLFTMIPRRTASDPPSPLELAIGAIAPVAITIAAWFEEWALSQVFWIALMVMMLGFVLPRAFGSRGRRQPPNSFVWIPIGFSMGILGSVLTAFGAALGGEHWWLHDVGRRMVLQGVFLSLVLGVGGLAVPLMTRGERPSDPAGSPRDRAARALHLTAAIVIAMSFFLDPFAGSAAMFVRAAIITSVLLLSADMSTTPKGPGLNRWLIWSSVWLVPVGYFLAGLLPDHPKAGLHVVFIGGFSLMVLAVSTQVSLGHGGLGALLAKRPAFMVLFAAALLLALVARVLMDLDAERFFVWMALAGTLFLCATGAWAALVTPALRR